jgi:asparagine synthase (glutamine-hydrolysing)
LFERWDDPHCRGLEPVDTPLRAAFIDLMRLLGDRAPVIMTGQGADAILYASHGYFIGLLKRGRIDRVVREALGYAVTRRRLPPLLFRSQLKRALHLASDEPPFPRWVRPHLRDRWRDYWSWRQRPLHPTRPEAAHFVQQPHWSSTFQSYDFAWTGVPAELAVPFLDTRVVEFLLSLPPMPHFADKDIVRRAMAGWLPDEVRLRPKRALGADPAEVLLRRQFARWLPLLNRPEMGQFVDTRILIQSVQSEVAGGSAMHHEIAALSLAVWFSYR